jgi:hypothetical protein
MRFHAFGSSCDFHLNVFCVLLDNITMIFHAFYRYEISISCLSFHILSFIQRHACRFIQIVEKGESCFLAVTRFPDEIYAFLAVMRFLCEIFMLLVAEFKIRVKENGLKEISL